MGEKYCDQHSGQCANTESLKREIEDIKLDLREQKGYVLGKFDHYSNELKDLSEKVTKIETTITDKFKYLEDKFKDMKQQVTDGNLDLKDEFQELKDSIKDMKIDGQTKEDKKENKLWVFIGQVASPLLVLAVWTAIQHFLVK